MRNRNGDAMIHWYHELYMDETVKKNPKKCKKRVMRRKRPVVAPGEMEEIKLTKEQLLKYPDLKTITIKIEEA